jgi:hypothetical protein
MFNRKFAARAGIGVSRPYLNVARHLSLPSRARNGKVFLLLSIVPRIVQASAFEGER